MMDGSSLPAFGLLLLPPNDVDPSDLSQNTPEAASVVFHPRLQRHSLPSCGSQRPCPEHCTVALCCRERGEKRGERDYRAHEKASERESVCVWSHNVRSIYKTAGPRFANCHQ